jgi:integrase/recombinase XerD
LAGDIRAEDDNVAVPGRLTGDGHRLLHIDVQKPPGDTLDDTTAAPSEDRSSYCDTTRRPTHLRGLHPATCQTLIGLLAVSGLRPGDEAIGLDRGDVDARHGLLRIIDAKFGKSREVALHTSTMDALEAYGRLRDQRFPRPACEAFFVSTAGTRLFLSCVDRVFARLVKTVSLEPRSPRCRPRLHDFRHSFAVRALLDWYATGVDVQARLPALSTYMGHVNPASTYY